MKTLHKTSANLGLRTVRADVVFGSPAKRCAGIGICQVTPHSTAPENKRIPCCQRVDTQINLPSADRLYFRFSRTKICKKMIARQFAYSRFRIDEALLLSDWLHGALLPDKSAAWELVPGTYPVEFSEEWISVSIRIRASQ